MRPDAPQKILLMLVLPGLLLAVNLGVDRGSQPALEPVFLVAPQPEFEFAAGGAPTQPLDPARAAVDRPNPRVDLTVQAPSESGATELARTLEAYLEVPSVLRLRPPWHPTPVSAAEERARWTYLLIRRAVVADLVGYDVAPLLQEGARRGRRTYAAEVLTERARAAAQRVASDPEHDPVVLENYLSLLTPEGDPFGKTDGIDVAFASTFGARLGQLEPVARTEGGPEAEGDAFRLSAIGYVRVEGHRVDLGSLIFFRPSDGLPALGRYLEDHGAMELRGAVSSAQ